MFYVLGIPIFQFNYGFGSFATVLVWLWMFSFFPQMIIRCTLQESFLPFFLIIFVGEFSPFVFLTIQLTLSCLQVPFLPLFVFSSLHFWIKPMLLFCFLYFCCRICICSAVSSQHFISCFYFFGLRSLSFCRRNCILPSVSYFCLFCLPSLSFVSITVSGFLFLYFASPTTILLPLDFC